MGGVEDHTGDVQQAGVVEAVQDLLVQPTPNTPARDQMRKRRWTVDVETPKQAGSARHAHPLTRT